MTYTAPSSKSFRERGGSLAKKLTSELSLIDTELDTLASASAAFGALADGKIIVGNGSGVATDVAMSGDAIIANTGAVTIQAGAVEESMMAVPTADGLNAARIARATYDFSVDGGAVGQIGLGVSLPDNAIVTRAWYQVVDGLTSADSTATVSLDLPTDDEAGLLAAIAINDGSSPWAAGNFECIQTGTVANFSEQCTAARELSMTIAVQDLTAGKFIVFAEYVVSD